MAFDFPSSPIVGQQFTPAAGVIYVWNGYAWVTPAATAGGSVSVDVPQCGQLRYVSATALSFRPFKGDRIKINGSIYAIPSGGIAGLGNTGVRVNGVAGQNLAASTFYYVGAFNNSGTITGEFLTSVWGHTTSTTAGNVGVETTADDSRSLIGMIYTNSAAQFVDSPQFRLVRTWFNDPGIAGYMKLAADRITGGAFPVNSGENHWFLSWLGEYVTVQAQTSVGNSATAHNYLGVGIDGTAQTPGAFTAESSAGFVYSCSTIPISRNNLSEGFHSVDFLCGVDGGIGTFYSNNSGLSVRTNGIGG